MNQTNVNGCEICLIMGDITACQADAIVNAANSGLRGGGGVDGAIHRAGGPSIMAECRRIGGCPTGEARATGAGRLPARYVIHAVGPIWRGGGYGEADLLASAYRSSLRLAMELQLDSVALPSLSTGAYGYPMAAAARVALGAAVDHCRQAGAPGSITFVLFTPEAAAAYEQALAEVVAGG